MRATVRDVAARAGVSQVTVSKVLRGIEGCASPQTRERVLLLAREMDYVAVPPPTMQRRHVATRTLGVVFGNSDFSRAPDAVEVFQGMRDASVQHGYDLLVMLHSQDEDETRRFLDRRADGYLFRERESGAHQSALRALVRHGVPVVTYYDRQVQGVAWVALDNRALVRRAVEHLVARGHRRLAYAGAYLKGITVQARHQAFAAEMEERGLLDGALIDAWPPQPLEAFVHRVVEAARDGKITAAVCYNDRTALELWEAAQAGGVRVPEQLSILGIDNDYRAAARGLTSIDVPFEKVGRRMVESLIRLIEGANPNECCHTIGGPVVERDSVGNAPS